MTIRKFIQKKLEELNLANPNDDEVSIEVGTEIPDDMLLAHE